MRLRIALLFAAAGAVLVTHASVSNGAAPATPEGLAEAPAGNFDHVYLRPGTDLRTYKKVLFEPATVTLRSDWLRNMNDTRDTSAWINNQDVQKITRDQRTWVRDAWIEIFRANGFRVVTSAEPNTLQLSPKVVDLYINAPDKLTPGRQITLTEDAGEATLVLEARDAVTKVLVLQVVDRRIVRRPRHLSLANSVTNRGDFSELFRQWAADATALLKGEATTPQ